MKIRNAGKYGIIKDLKPWELPAEAWSAGQNVRSIDGSMEKFLGSSSTGLGTPTAAPVALLAYRNTTNYFWIYAAGTAPNVTDIYVTDGMTHKELTNAGADYLGDTDDIWTGLVFGGIPIMNNGIDPPQSWDGDFAAANRFVNLANWPGSTECGAMRGFKQFLIAMNITKNGNEFPRMVKWSHSAGANAVPTSWDETDASKDAGEFELQDSTGHIVDGLAGGEIFYLYKDDAIWGMQYIGAPQIASSLYR